MFLSLCLLAGVMALSETSVRAQGDRVIVAGFLKEGRLEADGTGHYADFTRAVLAESAVPSQFVAVPVKRAVRDFAAGDSICMVPAAFRVWRFSFPGLTKGDIVESKPIDYITAHIVTRQGDPVISDVRELEGMRIGVWVGAEVDVFLKGIELTMIRAETEESSIKLLMSGRVDAIWNWNPDIYILFDRMKLGSPNLDPDAPIFGSTAHFMCRRTAATEALIRDVDRSIEAMRDDGRMRALLGPYTRIVGVDVPMDVAQPDLDDHPHK